MSASVGPIAAFGYPLAGAKFVYRTHPGLARWWLPPVLITTTLLGVVGYGALDVKAELAAQLWSAPVGEGFWFALAKMIYGLFEWLVGVAIFLVGLLAVALLSSVVAAPFNDALSREVERLCGIDQGAPAGSGEVLRDLGRTIRLELLKLAIYAAIMVPMFVASMWLPVVGQMAYSVFGFCISAAYFCIDYLDWPAARRGWTARRRLAVIWRHPGVALGFGAGVWVLLFLPLVNLLFMPAAVAGGTLLFLDLHAERPLVAGPE